jgi:hypothetical protein
MLTLGRVAGVLMTPFLPFRVGFHPGVLIVTPSTVFENLSGISP